MLIEGMVIELSGKLWHVDKANEFRVYIASLKPVRTHFTTIQGEEVDFKARKERRSIAPGSDVKVIYDPREQAASIKEKLIEKWYKKHERMIKI